MRRAAVVALVAGCYRPAPSPGAPCPTGDCPSGQRCIAGTCRAERDLDPDAGPGGPSDAPDAPAGWSMPALIPGVDTPADESDPSMTADRLTLVFTSNRAGGLGMDDIYIGTRATTADAFTVAAIAEINSAMRDSSPEISADGATIYFTSNRGGNFDVYTATRAGDMWSAPLPVPALNSGASESDVAISPDGLAAIVTRSSGAFLATRPSLAAEFEVPVLVPVLDVTGDVAGPSLTNGAAAVYLHGGGTRDLYVAYRRGTIFTTPMPITELNTPGRDAAPFIAGNGTRLLFEREGQIYETTR
jgi:hypothetical protein